MDYINDLFDIYIKRYDMITIDVSFISKGSHQGLKELNDYFKKHNKFDLFQFGKKVGVLSDPHFYSCASTEDSTNLTYTYGFLIIGRIHLIDTNELVYIHPIESKKTIDCGLGTITITSYITSLRHLNIKKVISANPKTIVIFKDGSKQIVTADNEPYDLEKGIETAIIRHILGKRSFDKWFKSVIDVTECVAPKRKKGKKNARRKEK